MSSSLVPRRDGAKTLAHVIETLLDKGLVLNADIMVSVGGVELLGIRIRAALASFETAARYGLEFPGGTNVDKDRSRRACRARGAGTRSEHVGASLVVRPGGGNASASSAEAKPGGVSGDFSLVARRAQSSRRIRRRASAFLGRGRRTAFADLKIST